jgi:hypothetical protein
MVPASPSSHRKPERPSSASKSTMMVTWGRSPDTCGRSVESNHFRQIPPRASAPSFSERSAVGPRLAFFGIEHVSERGDQDLAGLGIEVAVHPHHALEGGGDVGRRSWKRCSASASALRSSMASRQRATARLRSRIGSVPAVSTSASSTRENSAGSTSRAAARTAAAEREISPPAKASRARGMCSRARATRTSCVAAEKVMRNRCASHAEIERYPSRRNDPRRSISAARRASSPSTAPAARSSSAKSASNSSSDAKRKSSALSSSRTDRRVLIGKR